MTADTEKQPKGETVSEERPSWLPDNFKSPEELVKSYREAHAELTKRSQQLSELAREHERVTDELESLLAERATISRRVGLLERLFASTGGSVV